MLFEFTDWGRIWLIIMTYYIFRYRRARLFASASTWPKRFGPTARRQRAVYGPDVGGRAWLFHRRARNKARLAGQCHYLRQPTPKVPGQPRMIGRDVLICGLEPETSSRQLSFFMDVDYASLTRCADPTIWRTTPYQTAPQAA